jgi:hypothetical protein
VFYHRADVGVVREQLEGELGDVSHYDIEEDVLVAWPDDAYETELTYRLRRHRRGALSPKVSGKAPVAPAVSLDSARVLYRQQGVTWHAWERAYASAVDTTATLPRLLDGPPLLAAAPLLAPPGRSR